MILLVHLPADQSLIKNILKIITLCTDNAISNQPKSQAELNMEIQCRKLEAQLLADRERWKMLEQDLAREREWANRLQTCLRNTGAAYPLYPSYDFS